MPFTSRRLFITIMIDDSRLVIIRSPKCRTSHFEGKRISQLHRPKSYTVNICHRPLKDEKRKTKKQPKYSG